jgi:large subunit ribosomal protein L3
VDGILGKKLGMTQIYMEDGTAVPVTVVQAGPCLVVQRKTAGEDGNESEQLGLVEEGRKIKVGRPREGHFKKAGVAPMRSLVEFKVAADDETKAGDQVKASVFAVDDYVDVIGSSKGKGFQGVIKRHNFSGGKNTHGSMHHRQPGSMGASSRPSRVFKNHGLAGHMGDETVTTQKLKVVSVDSENNLLLLRGAVPGGKRAIVFIKKSKKAKD